MAAARQCYYTNLASYEFSRMLQNLYYSPHSIVLYCLIGQVVYIPENSPQTRALNLEPGWEQPYLPQPAITIFFCYSQE